MKTFGAEQRVELHRLALVPRRTDLPEMERQDQDEAARWAADMHRDGWLAFADADGMQAVAEKRRC